VFTTQPVLDELLVLRDDLLARPAPTSTDLAAKAGPAGFALFEGTYDAPYYIHGVAPYATEGGEFVFDEAGKPVVSKTEHLRLSVCVPPGPVPAGGFPVVFYSHGTGGDFRTVVEDRTCAAMTAVGLAAFGIDQVLHGPRVPANAECFGQPVENCFFNVVNAVAGRNLLRQSALDHVSLRRLVEGLEIPANVDPAGRAIRFDVRHAGFFGHSQGGLTGALYTAIAPDLAGSLLSGAGGHLTTSLLLRDQGALKTLAESRIFLNLAGHEPLEQFHPALALMQTLAEVADPASYARHWIRAPVKAPRSVFLTSGLLDPYTPASSAEALAVAAGLPQLRGGEADSALFRLAGLAPVDAPLHANITLGPDLAVTGALRQFPGQGHFPIFDDPTARRQLAEWFRTLAADGVPTLVAP
jgi:pimeloyl-ACP methyl ester carboxylesterase